MVEWVAFPPPGDLLDTGIESMSLVTPALVEGFITVPPGKPSSLDEKLPI